MSILDDEIFEQLLMMDDDDTHEFSRDIFKQFFEQVDDIVNDLQNAVDRKDWSVAKEKAHFLKGSASGVSSIQLKNICDELQHYEMHYKGDDPTEFFKPRIDSIKPAAEEVKKEMLKRMNLKEF